MSVVQSTDEVYKLYQWYIVKSVSSYYSCLCVLLSKVQMRCINSTNGTSSKVFLHTYVVYVLCCLRHRQRLHQWYIVKNAPWCFNCLCVLLFKAQTSCGRKLRTGAVVPLPPSPYTDMDCGSLSLCASSSGVWWPDHTYRHPSSCCRPHDDLALPSCALRIELPVLLHCPLALI